MVVRIKRAVIKNFKNLSGVTIDFHPQATALIGKNNAGKSSVLQALDTLFSFLGERVRLSASGLHQMVVSGRRTDLTVEIEVDFEAGTGDDAVVFGDKLAPHISNGRLMPFLYLKLMSEDHELGIGFRAGNEVKRFHTGPRASFSSGIDELLDAAGIDAVGGISVNLTPISDELEKAALLSASRSSRGRRTARGAAELEEDASNLLEFLLTLLSQDRQSYDAIVGRLRSIVPEVMDVATPLVHEGQEVYGIIRDAAHPGVEIDWNEVSSGTKQILQILGFATRAPVLLVEEPELSLHPDAVVQLMKILQSLAAAAGTQLVCSTHSPALIDSLGFGQIRVVSRPRDGPSEVHDMGDFAAVEKKMRTFGLSLGPLLASSGVDQAYPRFLLVVEGRDDRLIWPKLLERGGVEDLSVSIVNGNGWQDACAITRFLGFLKMIGVHSVDHLLVVDSDGDAEKRRGELLSLGLGDDEFVVLKEKELESYLLDEVALSAVTGKAVDDVAAAVKGAKGRGKEKLQEVLRTLGIASMDPGIMQAVVQQMPQLPEDLAEVVQRVKANVAE